MDGAVVALLLLPASRKLERRSEAGPRRPLRPSEGLSGSDMHLLAASGAFAPVDQHYLLQARQMQALSFAVHIPLVAFGISFPAMVLFVEWFGHRRGDELYLTLARRWSKVMLTLFAVA